MISDGMVVLEVSFSQWTGPQASIFSGLGYFTLTKKQQVPHCAKILKALLVPRNIILFGVDRVKLHAT